MIEVIEGTPGGGKTMLALEHMWDFFCAGKHVYTNIELIPSWPVLVAMRGLGSYLPDGMIQQRAEKLRKLYHRIEDMDQLPRTMRRENSRLCIFDEVQLMWNCRETKGRGADWLWWMSQHRKMGFQVYLIAQDFKMIDSQLRMEAEQLTSSQSCERWCIPLLIVSIPVGWFFYRLIGVMVFWRRTVQLKQKGMVTKRGPAIVTPFVARLYNTHQLFGEDGLAVGPPETPAAAQEREVPSWPPYRLEIEETGEIIDRPARVYYTYDHLADGRTATREHVREKPQGRWGQVDDVWREHPEWTYDVAAMFVRETRARTALPDSLRADPSVTSQETGPLARVGEGQGSPAWTPSQIPARAA